MELDAHLRSCTFEMLKDYITENEEQKDMMRKQLRVLSYYFLFFRLTTLPRRRSWRFSYLKRNSIVFIEPFYRCLIYKEEKKCLTFTSQPEAQDVESIAREFLIGKDWVKKERQMEKELMLQEARKQKEEDTIRQVCNCCRPHRLS